jgi:hypothetical protein
MSLRWMFDDAMLLQENGRLKGCLCLLLCLIDGLSARLNSGANGNRERYCGYLRAKLVEIGHDESWRIEEQNRLLHLAEIIYIYFRCNIVHEADDMADEAYEVQLSYGEIERSLFNTNVLMDRKRQQINVRTDWIVGILSQIAESDLELFERG